MVRLKAPNPWGFKIGKDMRRNQREKSKTDVVKLLLMVIHGRISRCLPTSPISSAKVLTTCERWEDGVCFSEHGWNISLGFECKLKGKWLTGPFSFHLETALERLPPIVPNIFYIYKQTFSQASLEIVFSQNCQQFLGPMRVFLTRPWLTISTQKIVMTVLES